MANNSDSITVSRKELTSIVATIINNTSSQVTESRVQEMIDESKQDLTIYTTNAVVDNMISTFVSKRNYVSVSRVITMIDKASENLSTDYNGKLEMLRGEVIGTCDSLSDSIEALNRERRAISNNNSGIAKALLQRQGQIPNSKKTKKLMSPAIRHRKLSGAKTE